jgi:hypothetical protein
VLLRFHNGRGAAQGSATLPPPRACRACGSGWRGRVRLPLPGWPRHIAPLLLPSSCPAFPPACYLPFSSSPFPFVPLLHYLPSDCDGTKAAIPFCL